MHSFFFCRGKDSSNSPSHAGKQLLPPVHILATSTKYPFDEISHFRHLRQFSVQEPCRKLLKVILNGIILQRSQARLWNSKAQRPTWLLMAGHLWQELVYSFFHSSGKPWWLYHAGGGFLTMHMEKPMFCSLFRLEVFQLCPQTVKAKTFCSCITNLGRPIIHVIISWRLV